MLATFFVYGANEITGWIIRETDKAPTRINETGGLLMPHKRYKCTAMVHFRKKLRAGDKPAR
ncbi:hypothetical protein A936_11594 [Enterobacter sp. Ag1]|nr:hypothetical protein A936_11594 [Enterobacter sp. Ag1]